MKVRLPTMLINSSIDFITNPREVVLNGSWVSAVHAARHLIVAVRDTKV